MIFRQNIRDPIEYVVDSMKRRQSLVSCNGGGGSSGNDPGGDDPGGNMHENLPTEPVYLEYDEETNKLIKVITGDKDVEYEPLLIEELNYDSNGELVSVKTIYPNGDIKTRTLFFDEDNLISYK